MDKRTRAAVSFNLYLVAGSTQGDFPHGKKRQTPFCLQSSVSFSEACLGELFRFVYDLSIRIYDSVAVSVYQT